MTDRELLEAAAKAAGYEINGWAGDCPQISGAGSYTWSWNPLADDGDALRLAVRLKIDIGFSREGESPFVFCHAHDGHSGDGTLTNESLDSAEAATRRAIVRAAAAMVQP